MSEEVEETITVPLETIQVLFDTVCGGMDFGSGNLDDNEVEHLRALAVILGQDPKNATPDNFKCRYYGTCSPWELPSYAQPCHPMQWICYHCRRPLSVEEVAALKAKLPK